MASGRAAVLLEATATSAAAIDYCDVLGASSDGIVACALTHAITTEPEKPHRGAVATYTEIRSVRQSPSFPSPTSSYRAMRCCNGRRRAVTVQRWRAAPAGVRRSLCALQPHKQQPIGRLPFGAITRTFLLKWSRRGATCDPARHQPCGPPSSALDATNRLTNRELVVLPGTQWASDMRESLGNSTFRTTPSRLR